MKVELAGEAVGRKPTDEQFVVISWQSEAPDGPYWWCESYDTMDGAQVRLRREIEYGHGPVRIFRVTGLAEEEGEA